MKTRMPLSIFFFLFISLLALAFNNPVAQCQIQKDRATKKIAILMYSDELRYLQSKDIFLETLFQSGFSKDKLSVSVESAKTLKANAATVVERLKKERPDLIFTLGTTATQAVVTEIKDIPVVFSSVYDPVAAGIAKKMENSENNTTGNTSKVPMKQLIKELRSFSKLQKIAVLYTPSEKNSESQVRELQSMAEDLQYKIIPVPISQEEDVDHLMPDIINNADSIFLSGSNVVGAQINKILEYAEKKQIVTFSHLWDLVEKGALIGYCANHLEGGRLAAEYATQVLKGARPSSLPILSPKNPKILINLKTAHRGNYTIPESFMQKKPITLP